MHFAVLMSQILMDLSPEPLMMMLLMAKTEKTGEVWPLSVLMHFAVPDLDGVVE